MKLRLAVTIILVLPMHLNAKVAVESANKSFDLKISSASSPWELKSKTTKGRIYTRKNNLLETLSLSYFKSENTDLKTWTRSPAFQQDINVRRENLAKFGIEKYQIRFVKFDESISPSGAATIQGTYIVGKTPYTFTEVIQIREEHLLRALHNRPGRNQVVALDAFKLINEFKLSDVK